MTPIPSINEPQSLYKLAWSYAPGSMFAFDVGIGKLVDANPAAGVPARNFSECILPRCIRRRSGSG
jgi:hypothetical protein